MVKVWNKPSVAGGTSGEGGVDERRTRDAGRPALTQAKVENLDAGVSEWVSGRRGEGSHSWVMDRMCDRMGWWQ